MEAAIPSNLSQKWLQKWHSTSNIDFNQLLFVNPNDDAPTQQTQTIFFLNFIKNFIQNHHGRHVDTFRLKFSKAYMFPQDVELALAFAFQRGVKKLDLDFTNINNDENHEIPLFHLKNNVFECYNAYGEDGEIRGLESIRLYGCGFLMSDLMRHYFLGLKEVSFGYVGLKIGDLKMLLLLCKGIESLSLKMCKDLENFDMGEDPMMLSKLEIEKCDFEIDYLRMNAPNLKVFKYGGNVIRVSEIEVKKNVIEEAHLNFDNEYELELFGDILYGLLNDLTAVRVLSVCSYFLQAIPNGEEPMRTCYDMNVRHLMMNTGFHPHEMPGISFLLNSCPLLHTITFHIQPARHFPYYEAPYDFDPKKMWTSRVIYYECVKKNLKVVEVKDFRGTYYEVVILCFFVGAGKALEMMNIYPAKHQKEEDQANILKAIKFLNNRRHASDKLIITVY